MRLYINYKNNSEYIDDEPNVIYNNITYTNAQIDDDSGYGEPIDFNVKIGDFVYIVEIVYNTGDSILTEYDCSEIFWIFNNYTEAIELKKEVEEDITNKETRWKPTLLNYKREKVISTGFYKGYFDHFTKCNIIKLEVVKK